MARDDVGVPHHVPMVVMDWGHQIEWHWLDRWQDAFPESEYGKVILDTHVYDFKDTVEEARASWDAGQWPSVKAIAARVPLIIGEYTLALGRDIPAHERQPWARWIQERLRSTGTLGGALWLWNNQAHGFWSMRYMSNLDKGGINWARVFSH